MIIQINYSKLKNISIEEKRKQAVNRIEKNIKRRKSFLHDQVYLKASK